MSGKENCPDCGVQPGAHHNQGCDVARCPDTGLQAAGCGHVHTVTSTWSGEWPGVAECREFGWVHAVSGFEDLNRLYLAAHMGEVVWDRTAQRWQLLSDSSLHAKYHGRGVYVEACPYCEFPPDRKK